MAFFFVFSAVGISFALEKGNKRKGKYTYRKVYKACMARGEVDKPKPIVNPDAHTQAEWTTIFEKKEFAELAPKEKEAAQKAPKRKSQKKVKRKKLT